MSIPFADAAQTAVPVTSVPTTQPESSPLLTVIVLIWFVGAIVAAKRAGVFRRRSIIGPQRLADEDSGWWLVILLFAAYFVGALVGATVDALITVNADAKLLLLNVVIYGAAAPVLLVGLRLLRGNAPESFGVSPPYVLTGIAAGALVLFILYPAVTLVSELTMYFIHWAHLPAPQPHPVLQSLGKTHNVGLISLDLLAALVVAPVCEELAFRGFLQTSLSRMFSWTLASTTAARWTAVIVTAGAFAAVHGQWAFVPPLFVLAVGLGYVYERTGNLWVTISTHALFNSMQILVFFAGSP